MTKLSVNKIESSRLFSCLDLSHNQVDNSNKNNNLIKLKRHGLLKQVGVMLSFTNALKFASQQSKWSIADREFLLVNTLWLQEQGSFLAHKLKPSIEPAYLENNDYIRLDGCGRGILRYVTDAIAAINVANFIELAFALDAITNTLKRIQQIFLHSLEQECI